MSSQYDFMLEQARQKPNSTAAIGLQAIREEQWRVSEARKHAAKTFFMRIFTRK